jgi:hypothetical protein
MHPIKNHRIVLATVLVGNGHDRRGAALESAENEGWPPERQHQWRRVGKGAVATFPAIQFATMGADE